MDSNTHDQLVYEAHRKSTGVTYLLWFFLGAFGAHRFYLGRKKSAIFRLLLLLIPVVGWSVSTILWIIDAFRIPGLVAEENVDLLQKIGLARPAPQDPRLSQGAPDPELEPTPAPRRSLDPRVEEIREMRRR